ncbi:type II toxin-antitoxin system VapC family toxin [Microbacterium thalassium]|uniref:Ribonuclease VapC n=1 Tax=Microbacterium thalassium TaxID=362649 RepID=A0A7X0FT81_9MICO|nr:type II toxin-antitoxin system VapC family toxin [Microbacterium thalassium]MBB6392722.1 putative nucleic acid-binding protein [Microbacterium thalassium]GLK23046.1 ribonuclease VapC [Microbacterium thalassium]
MTVAYLDTSAAVKLLVEEPESAALVDTLTAMPNLRLAASWLLHTELHCAAGRHPDAIDADAVRTVLDTIDLVDLTRGDMIAAGTLAPLRSNEAIHLAVAIRLGIDDVVTYDQELADAARRAGLGVMSPR